jgi:cytidylate kinase
MSGNLSFPTGVQERLSGWTRIQESLKAKASGRPRPCPTVTISRQYGCEGFPLSLRVQELLQKATGEPWSVLDRALLEAVARDEHVPMELLEHLEARSRYLEAYGFHPRGALTGDEAFAKLAVSLLHFARAGNAIIIGRGGAVLCRRLENCFHFRLEASREWRIASLARRLGISPEEAADREKRESKARDRFVRDNLAADVGDPSHYDAVFNNERHDVEHIAAAILAYVRCGM